jgi:myo-inositol-1(or 4)-monophosphatase
LLDINDINISKFLNLAEKAALQSGVALVKNKVAWNFSIDKPKRDKKLLADIESERILLEQLLTYSEYPVLTEESGWHGINTELEQRIEPNVFWIIDPLDGTVNYSMNIPLCCVSIALVCNKKPVLGVIYDFYRDELFSGGYGQGATMNGEKIKVSKLKKKSESIIMTGFPKARDFSDHGLARFGLEVASWQKVRMLGSAALSMAYVAAGRADAYKEENIMPWDIAGGWALIEFAGGNVHVRMDDFLNPITISASNGCII